MELGAEISRYRCWFRFIYVALDSGLDVTNRSKGVVVNVKRLKTATAAGADSVLPVKGIPTG